MEDNNHRSDPSENVRAALHAEVSRLNDIVDLGFRHLETKLEGEIRRVDEKIKLQQDANALLNIAESKRLDSIRNVDINAVAVASERATQQASVLSNQATSSAETLRTLVATTAATVATQLNQISTNLSDRITSLEKSSYEGIGKGRIADPQMEALLNEVKHLRDASTTHQGRSSGMSSSWVILVGAVGLISTILTMFLALKK